MELLKVSLSSLGIGNETIVPSSNMGLTIPPFEESKPFLLNITFIIAF